MLFYHHPCEVSVPPSVPFIRDIPRSELTKSKVHTCLCCKSALQIALQNICTNLHGSQHYLGILFLSTLLVFLIEILYTYLCCSSEPSISVSTLAVANAYHTGHSPSHSCRKWVISNKHKQNASCRNGTCHVSPSEDSSPDIHGQRTRVGAPNTLGFGSSPGLPGMCISPLLTKTELGGFWSMNPAAIHLVPKHTSLGVTLLSPWHPDSLWFQVFLDGAHLDPPPLVSSPCLRCVLLDDRMWNPRGLLSDLRATHHLNASWPSGLCTLVPSCDTALCFAVSSSSPASGR